MVAVSLHSVLVSDCHADDGINTVKLQMALIAGLALKRFVNIELNGTISRASPALFIIMIGLIGLRMLCAILRNKPSPD